MQQDGKRVKITTHDWTSDLMMVVLFGPIMLGTGAGVGWWIFKGIAL